MGSPRPFKNEGTNWGDAVSDEIVRGLPPELTSENTNGALNVFTVCGDVKVKLAGDDCNLAPVTVAVTDREMLDA